LTRGRDLALQAHRYRPLPDVGAPSNGLAAGGVAVALAGLGLATAGATGLGSGASMPSSNSVRSSPSSPGCRGCSSAAAARRTRESATGTDAQLSWMWMVIVIAGGSYRLVVRSCGDSMGMATPRQRRAWRGV